MGDVGWQVQLVEPHRPVNVFDRGTWYDGWLRAWALRPDGGWSALATWHVATGRQYYFWVDADRVRPRQL